MEKFCWVCDVGAWKILWLSFWLCENLFVHGHELVGIFFFFNSFFLSWTCRNFFAWLWKNLVVVYGYVKNFDYGKISTIKYFVGCVMLFHGKFVVMILAM